MVNRPTSLQLEALVEFLEQNPGIAKGLLRTSQGKQEIKRKWARLATNLNSLGGVSKDGPGWAKYWAEKKSGLKRLCSRYAASMRQTGGGVGYEVPILTGIDRRLLAVMGGQSFATGDRELSINPFPQTQSVAETNAPSTSAAENVTLPVLVGIEEDEVVPRPIIQTPGTSQEVHSDAAPELLPPHSRSATNASRRRSRRLISSHRSENVEMDRLAAIEERRVEAEHLTAEALADTSRRLDRVADAAEHIAQAITQVATALLEIANSLGR